MFSQNTNEGGEEGSGQARVEDGLNANNGGIRAIPLGESGIETSWDVSERSTSDDLEEGIIHLLVIWFEVALDVNDKGSRDRREQTSLFPSDQHKIHPEVKGTRRNTHKDQCAIQVFVVFLDNGAIVIIGCALKLGVKFGAGVSCGREVWKGSRQGSKYSALDAKNDVKKRGEIR